MKWKTIEGTFGILLSLLATCCACNSPSNIDQGPTPLQQESNRNKKIELAPEATVIYRDKKGNLWLASRAHGVYQYNGTTLALFTAKEGLGSYRITSVQEDQLGNLYFDTPEAVYRYDGKKFTSLPIAERQEPQPEWQIGPNDLWFQIGWDKSGPYRFDGEKLHHLKFPKNNLEDAFFQKYPNASYNPYGIYSIFHDSKGNVWFGTACFGIYLFDGKELSWRYENQWTETPDGGDFGIRSIAEDQEGNYWICNANYRYALLPNDVEGDGLKSINHTRQMGIAGAAEDQLYFFSMETDGDGNLWMFANEDGLWLNNGKELTQCFIKDGGKNIAPTSMYKDPQGTLWLGTRDKGIYKYAGGVFEKFEIIP